MVAMWTGLQNLVCRRTIIVVCAYQLSDNINSSYYKGTYRIYRHC